MPVTYHIDMSRRMIFTTAQGVLTKNDIRDHHVSLVSNPNFDASYSQLIDLLGVTKFEVTTSEMGAVADHEKIFNEKIRRAIVAPQDHVFGMARMYQSLHDKALEEVHVFRDMEEARRWLGLPETLGDPFE